MKIAPNAAAAAIAASVKTSTHNEMNPAKQAKAAEPAVRGAEFGHLVSQFARAKHAAPPPPEGSIEPPTGTEPGETVDLTV